ncbi:MAG: hypothetical protein ACI4MK_12590 [Aristaeellaceae bacterium]
MPETIQLATKFAPYTDEQFKNESKLSLVTNKEFDWTGAHTVKVYKVSTSSMNDYGRSGPAEGNWSRYGNISDLGATTEEFTLKKDRSFIFNVDKLDADETAQQVQAASALARQNREVIIPEIDSYVYGVMAAGAGTTAAAKALDAASIYVDILEASKALDDAEVPETGRVLLVTPATYLTMKKSQDIVLETDVGAEMRLKGVIGILDGANVIRVPSVRLPAKFGFMLCHPSATVAPVKLEDYNIHENTIYSSGAVVTGRVCYDAFVLDNKKKGIYYQPTT